MVKNLPTFLLSLENLLRDGDDWWWIPLWKNYSQSLNLGMKVRLTLRQKALEGMVTGSWIVSVLRFSNTHVTNNFLNIIIWKHFVDAGLLPKTFFEPFSWRHCNHNQSFFPKSLFQRLIDVTFSHRLTYPCMLQHGLFKSVDFVCIQVFPNACLWKGTGLRSSPVISFAESFFL